MTLEQIGDSFKNVVSEPEEYHESVFVNGKVWLFARKYFAQPTFNWGGRVACHGSYAAAFDTNKKQWEKEIKFPALTNEENTAENFFVFDNAVHLALSSNFEQVHFNKIFRWNGETWEEKPLKAFAAIKGEGKVDTVVAVGTSESEKYFVSTFNQVIRVHKLTSIDGTFHIEQIHEVPDDVNIRHGKAVSAIQTGSRLIISFGVMGCGFRWEKYMMIAVDLNTNKSSILEIPEESGNPPFSFSGSAGNGVSKNGDWLHISGCSQVGMCGSQYEGDVWALTNLSGTPEWKKVTNIPETQSGNTCVDTQHNAIYIISKENVAKASI